MRHRAEEHEGVLDDEELREWRDGLVESTRVRPHQRPCTLTPSSTPSGSNRGRAGGRRARPDRSTPSPPTRSGRHVAARTSSRSRRCRLPASSPSANVDDRQRRSVPVRRSADERPLSHLGQHRCRRVNQRSIGRAAHTADRVVRIVDITEHSGAEQKAKVGQVDAGRVIGGRGSSSTSSGRTRSARRRSPAVAAIPELRARGSCAAKPDDRKPRRERPSLTHAPHKRGKFAEVGVGHNGGLERRERHLGLCDEPVDRERLLCMAAGHVERSAVRLRQRGPRRGPGCAPARSAAVGTASSASNRSAGTRARASIPAAVAEAGRFERDRSESSVVAPASQRSRPASLNASIAPAVSPAIAHTTSRDRTADRHECAGPARPRHRAPRTFGGARLPSRHHHLRARAALGGAMPRPPLLGSAASP